MQMKIALVGNPNSGKSTLFNAMTGANQFVGNWPGVTVEKKEGSVKGYKGVRLVDLPGIYSLSPYSLEEVISRNYLTEEKPDLILNVIDGTNLERNLYLTTQLIELGIPLVLAINMVDIIEKRGGKIEVENLASSLGCRVVPISATKGIGVHDLIPVAIEELHKSPASSLTYVNCVEAFFEHVEETFLANIPIQQRRWYAVKLFERDEKIQGKLGLCPENLSAIETLIKACEDEMQEDSESIVTSARYTYIDSIIRSCCSINISGELSYSDKIDSVVTNRIFALPFFAAVMSLVYYVSVTSVGSWATDWTNDVLFGEIIPPLVENVLITFGIAAWLQGLILDGIVAGVGAVLGFVPQMLILFAFLAFLEGCGYMARVAFIMDRVFRRFGLSGKSFIPMLIGTGCSVPAIMASRTIENENDRKMTIMTTSFVPCSAKLPIIALLSGALFGGAWWVAPSAYFVGVLAIIVSGLILKNTTLFSGDVAPFIMELPAYHMPTLSNIVHSMWERGFSFIKKAGSVVLLSTVFIWFTSRFGWSEGYFGMLPEEEIGKSLLAVIGSSISWLFSPLGWGDWKATVATLTGLVAKENVVGTIGILYGFAEVSEDGAEIWQMLSVHFTALSGYSFLIFNLLCAPCFAAMGAIKREMNSFKWFSIAIAYQCVFAYAVALCVYQIGRFFIDGIIDVSTIVAFLVASFFIYMLVRVPAGKRKNN